MKRIFLLSIVLFTFTFQYISGETVLNSLEEIAEYGSENNLNYKSSQVALLQAEEDLISFIRLGESSLSTEVGYTEILNTEESKKEEGWGISSTLTLPVIDQLSINGNIDNNKSGYVGISISPLIHSDNRIQSKLNYNSTMITAENNRISAEIGSVQAALSWMIEKRDLEADQSSSELLANLYNDDMVRYDLGELTLENLQDSFLKWSEARKELSEQQQNYRKAESMLYSELGNSMSEIKIKMIDVEDMENSLIKLKNEIDPLSGSSSKFNTYLLSLIDVEIAKAKLKNSWSFSPDLVVSGNLNYNSSGITDLNASVNFSFSLDDFDKAGRSIKKEELKISYDESEQAYNESELFYEQNLEALKSSLLNSEISKLELEQAEILLSEAEFLSEQGEFSAIELKQSQLTLSLAKNSYFQALAEEYLAWMEFKKYI